MSTSYDLLSLNMPLATDVGTPLNNSAAETAIATVAIPSEFINVVGRTARVRFIGKLSCLDAGHTLSFNILLGSTSIAAVSSFNPGVVSNRGWIMEVDLTTLVAGVGGSVASSAATMNLYGDGLTYIGVSAPSVNFDSEAGTALVLNAAWGAAIDGDTITCTQALLTLGGLR